MTLTARDVVVSSICLVGELKNDLYKSLNDLQVLQLLLNMCCS
jgi:hypothetical protein